MIKIYTQLERGQNWLEKYRRKLPHFVCVLGFTETGLIEGISAAGATPEDRKYTAIADAEFLANGVKPNPQYPLPPLHIGASPVLISRAVIETLNIPLWLFDAGLPHPPSVPAIALGGQPAKCISTGKALPLSIVKNLLDRGLFWGEKLTRQIPSSYLIIGECVVGGTTTALSVLTGLGFAARGKTNSSHPSCNHEQKWAIAQQGLNTISLSQKSDPLKLVAAVGDPMQIVVAGMAISASRQCGVLLAGGTQMLAVYALLEAIANLHSLPYRSDRIVVGTTRWVAEDATGDTVGLAEAIANVPLLATQLDFTYSHFENLRAYERGYVKEGVGAGGCAIAAHLRENWHNDRLVTEIDAIANRLLITDN
ncbi:MAG: TIGR00303 family protein [Cyanobacteria bacterium SBLK]|nr:TIGR00303 family protein [Cyanobacteria bacterium SBLK]